MTLVRFEDVIHLSTTRTADPASAGIDRFVGLEHIEPENLHIRSWGNVADGTTFTNTFKSGQVLFGKRRAYQRKVAVADFDGVCSSDIYVFESKDPNVLLPELVPFILQSEGFYDYAVKTSAGSLSPRTNWSHLANYEFPLPPVDEQRRIADLLWAADGVIEKSRDLLYSIFQLRKSVEQLSFSLNTESRLESYLKDATVGIVVKPEALYTKSDDGIPVLMAENVVDGNLSREILERITLEAHERYEKSRLCIGDVVITRRGNVGRAAVVGEFHREWNTIDLLIFRCDSKLMPEYLADYLNSPVGQSLITAYSSGTAISFLGVNTIKKIPIDVPELKKQEQIIEKLRAISETESTTKNHMLIQKKVYNSLLNSQF